MSRRSRASASNPRRPTRSARRPRASRPTAGAPQGFIGDVVKQVISNIIGMKGRTQSARPRAPRRGALMQMSNLPRGVASTTSNSGPYFRMDGNKMVVGNTELIGPITINEDFTCFVVCPNPTWEDLCPWLAKFSDCFQFYTWKKLELMYVPSVGSTREGTVMWGFSSDPNSVSSRPTTSAELMALPGAVAGVSWNPLRFSVPFESLKGLVNHHLVGSMNMDVNTRDDPQHTPGMIFSATEGAPAGAPFPGGNVYCSYEIELSRINSPATRTLFAHATTAVPNSTALLGTAAGTVLNPTIQGAHLASCEHDVTAQSVILADFRSKRFIVHMHGHANATTFAAAPTVTGTNCTATVLNAGLLGNAAMHTVFSVFVPGSLEDAEVEVDWTATKTAAGNADTLRIYISPWASNITYV